MSAETELALALVRAERSRQDSLWGDQSGNHPFEWVSILGEEYGELCEAVNETYFGKARHPERGGAEAIIKEAVHVAAVAVEIIEAMLSTDDGKRCARESEQLLPAAWSELVEKRFSRIK